MRRDEQHRRGRAVEAVEYGVAVVTLTADRPQQSVDDRIAGHGDGSRRDILGEQVGLAGRRGGEMQRGEPGGQPPVDFLWIGRVRIPVRRPASR